MKNFTEQNKFIQRMLETLKNTEKGSHYSQAQCCSCPNQRARDSNPLHLDIVLDNEQIFYTTVINCSADTIANCIFIYYDFVNYLKDNFDCEISFYITYGNECCFYRSDYTIYGCGSGQRYDEKFYDKELMTLVHNKLKNN